MPAPLLLLPLLLATLAALPRSHAERWASASYASIDSQIADVAHDESHIATELASGCRHAQSASAHHTFDASLRGITERERASLRGGGAQRGTAGAKGNLERLVEQRIAARTAARSAHPAVPGAVLLEEGQALAPNFGILAASTDTARAPNFGILAPAPEAPPPRAKPCPTKVHAETAAESEAIENLRHVLNPPTEEKGEEGFSVLRDVGGGGSR